MRSKKPIIILLVVLILLILIIAAVLLLRGQGAAGGSGEQPPEDTSSERTDVAPELTPPDDALSPEDTAQEQEPDDEFVGPVYEGPRTLEATIAVAGDIVAHAPINADAYDSATDTYSYERIFADAVPLLSGADYAIADFESTFSGDGTYSGYPQFDSPDAWADALKYAGVDLVSLANNHSLDSWFSGLCRTLDVLDDRGLEHIGTYRTQEERDEQNGVILKDLNGISVAFLDYTYGTNGIPVPEGKEFAVNIFNLDYMTNLSQFDYDKVGADLKYARSLEPDFIVFIIHWGQEYQTSPNNYQLEIADWLLEQGVDVILGQHVHVPQPMEMRQAMEADGTITDCFVSYCLGNFISNQYDPYTNLTAVLNITLTKDALTGETALGEVSYTPMIMSRAGDYTPHYAILDIYKILDAYESGDGTVSEALYAYASQGLRDIHTIMGEEFDYRVIHADD